MDTTKIELTSEEMKMLRFACLLATEHFEEGYDYSSDLLCMERAIQFRNLCQKIPKTT